MCGRFQLSVTGKQISERFNTEVFDELYKPSYNCAPGQFLPVIANSEPKKLQSFFWGFIPPWIKSGQPFKPLINSRAETIAEKPAFKNAFRTQRCIIPANGFYEWATTAGKQAYRIFLKSEDLFAMAGIWTSFTQSDSTIRQHFSIVTTEANALMKPIHSRMPVILRPDEEQMWLFENDTEKLKKLLHPFPADQLQKLAISKRINAVKNDDASLILPDVPQKDLFSEL
ncbi:MAG: SOS response-associated peptidase [Bacteroidetes bacterium]|nr:SOS response-associated peptidase [Bacteroidota bacterium]MBU1578518.1 SOS response-associated peptidase [Bacteroidota bacterium]MBU2465729.1 SOS response-associated peptidase [Bacteroidota bacterium]MBU2558769.1 SOS response-associated peptidase [Bacteroidota bacterium]